MTSAFCTKVTAALNKGWELHGSPTYAFDAAKGVMRCGQAVVKDVPGTYTPDTKLGEHERAARRPTVARDIRCLKTNPGAFSRSNRLGEKIIHAVPRTVTAGERALYHALYPPACAHSSDPFARSCGLASAPLDDLAAFHVVFGKTVPDISLNAVANLGYAEGRWLQPSIRRSLRAESTVIGLKENSNGTSGVSSMSAPRLQSG